MLFRTFSDASTRVPFVIPKFQNMYTNPGKRTPPLSTRTLPIRGRKRAKHIFLVFTVFRRLTVTLKCDHVDAAPDLKNFLPGEKYEISPRSSKKRIIYVRLLVIKNCRILIICQFRAIRLRLTVRPPPLDPAQRGRSDETLLMIGPNHSNIYRKISKQSAYKKSFHIRSR